MPEREMTFGKYQPFVQQLNAMGRQEVKPLLTESSAQGKLSGEGIKKLRESIGMKSGDQLNPQRLAEFQEIMLPVILAMMYTDNYKQKMNPDEKDPSGYGI
jgi:hypothetical protein